jgi:hypothetical protein
MRRKRRKRKRRKRRTVRMRYPAPRQKRPLHPHPLLSCYPLPAAIRGTYGAPLAPPFPRREPLHSPPPYLQVRTLTLTLMVVVGRALPLLLVSK